MAVFGFSHAHSSRILSGKVLSYLSVFSGTAMIVMTVGMHTRRLHHTSPLAHSLAVFAGLRVHALWPSKLWAAILVVLLGIVNPVSTLVSASLIVLCLFDDDRPMTACRSISVSLGEAGPLSHHQAAILHRKLRLGHIPGE